MGNISRRDTILQDFKVSKPQELLEFLLEKQVRKSRNAIKSLLAHKQITVNGKIVTLHNHGLKAGDKVNIMKFDQSRKEKKLPGLKIVFEDDDLIVIDKEAGYLTVSTDKEKSRTVYNSLNEYVKKKGRNNRVFVLHRLDREVSGLLVFARSAEIQAIFQKNWDSLVKEYIYTAVVEGKPKKENGTIKSWLTENKNLVMLSSAIDNGGMEAVTHYKTVKSSGRYTQLDFNLETKRKNQLRVQMQSIGHPVVGDKKYGAPNNPIKRMALHVRYMLLKHPMTNSVLEFSSVIPRSMQNLVNPRPAEKKEPVGKKE